MLDFHVDVEHVNRKLWLTYGYVLLNKSLHSDFLQCFYTCLVSLIGFRYLCSLVETILIYQHFNKPAVAEQPSPKQELLDFWMDFLVEATKKDVSSVRFPVRDSN